jgi:hypothetical protein
VANTVEMTGIAGDGKVDAGEMTVLLVAEKKQVS